MSFEDFLQRIVEFINEVRIETRREIYQAYADQIAEYYYTYKKEGLLETIQEALGTDVELLSLVLFTLHFITKDPDCIYELRQLVFRKDLDIYAAMDIIFQIGNISFRDDKIQIPYVEQRQVQEYLLERIESELLSEIPTPYLPYEKRNKQRIILATDVLLELVHAPTALIYRVADCLNSLGYEVIIVVNVQLHDLKRGEQYCFAPYTTNYNKMLDTFTVTEYQGKRYPVYQFFFQKGKMDQQRQLFHVIHEYNPLLIWYIGGSSPIGDLYQRMTTEVSMGCTDGYICSCSPVLLSYMQSGSEDVQKSIGYAETKGQKLYNIKWGKAFFRENFSLTRKELGIPEDSFVLCVVGNRLDGEMSRSFIGMLKSLVESSKIYHIVLIGKCSQDILQEIDSARYSLLGFRSDLVDVIAMTDLFVNPPRQGGGGGAARAFAVDVPVVTYPYCDVSNVTGQDFCCKDLNEMEALIRRYAQDREFYEQQQEKAREVYRDRVKVSDSLADELKKMLGQIRQWMEEGII